jgi:hypothetical protein
MRRSLPAGLALLLVLLAALAVAPPAARAHVPSSPATPHVATASEVGPVAAPATGLRAGRVPGPMPAAATPAVLLVGLLVLGVSRRRRAPALLLVLVLALFGFEAALHSVHHLSDADPGMQCAVASAAAHVGSVAVDAGGNADIVPAEPGRLTVPVVAALVSRPLRASAGRAPPVPSA